MQLNYFQHQVQNYIQLEDLQYVLDVILYDLERAANISQRWY
jgi:hypothetical protein